MVWPWAEVVEGAVGYVAEGYLLAAVIRAPSPAVSDKGVSVQRRAEVFVTLQFRGCVRLASAFTFF